MVEAHVSIKAAQERVVYSQADILLKFLSTCSRCIGRHCGRDAE